MHGHAARSHRGSPSEDNTKAAQWAGPSPAHSPFMHPYAQPFFTPEEIVRSDRPPSSASETMHPNAMYHDHLDPTSQQV